MTYVQRLPRLPVTSIELSGRTVILLLVAAFHLVLVALIVDRLARVKVADELFVPPDITLLPPAEPRAAVPPPPVPIVLEVPRIVMAPPVLDVASAPDANSSALDAAPGLPDEARGWDPPVEEVVRALPRLDPERPIRRPPYPPTSVRLGETGVVLVNICVDETGAATGVTLRESSGFPRLDDAAVRNLRQRSTRLLPGTENGVPVPMCTDLRVRFDLE